jgi:diguanylate cyclase (GGDEF)-like protein/PAS domain S-box-containing protein
VLRALPPFVRAAIHLSLLTVSVLLLAHLIGWLPDFKGPLRAKRQVLCESLAIHCSLAAQRADTRTLCSIAEAIAERNPEILSFAIRNADGEIVVARGDHEAHWKPRSGGRSTLEQVQVPITCDNRPWGTVEISFRPSQLSAPFSFLEGGLTKLIAFVSIAGFLAYTLYLRSAFRESKTAIPERVRKTLNTLVEGVLVINKQQRIALANNAFASAVGEPPAELEGRHTSDFSWTPADARSRLGEYPWSRAVERGTAEMGTMLGLTTRERGQRTFLVNAAPVEADDGTCRGAIATFDDVTMLKQKEQRLRKALVELRDSQERIRRQNEKLKEAATRDPLTSCLNRRAFFEIFEDHWASAVRDARPLGCLMIDVDHFKLVNDRFGHRTGDRVLQRVAAELRSHVGTRRHVARYGGEEFCVVLPGADIDETSQEGERLRARIASQQIVGVSITISVGASALSLGSKKPSELLDQADQALYAAKRAGRNRAVRWDDRPEETIPDVADASDVAATEARSENVPVSFQAVASLLSALEHRHSESAEHSRRVAELAVATGRGILSHQECYVLEIGALLHDIGKIGVPDAVLLKPGSLTDGEWRVMEQHERIGTEITSAVFGCQALTEIVRNCHTWYAGERSPSALPRGDEIPVGARLLSIADAYDAMVSDRVYRQATTQEKAFAELRRCAGTQFDPVLVERFIEVVRSRDQSRSGAWLTASKQIALKIGLETERLADALDRRDVDELAHMARCLRTTAQEHGVCEIEELAAELEECAESDPDLVSLVDLTVKLLELCRSTQRACLSEATAARRLATRVTSLDSHRPLSD